MPRLPSSTSPIFEQPPGTGSSRDQTAPQGQAGLSRVPSRGRTLAGYEALHMIRKGQARWVGHGVSVGRIYSSTSSSNWRPETQHPVAAPAAHSPFSKLQHLRPAPKVVRPAPAGRIPSAGGSSRPRMAPALRLLRGRPECRGACASRLRRPTGFRGRAGDDGSG